MSQNKDYPSVDFDLELRKQRRVEDIKYVKVLRNFCMRELYTFIMLSLSHSSTIY